MARRPRTAGGRVAPPRSGVVTARAGGARRRTRFGRPYLGTTPRVSPGAAGAGNVGATRSAGTASRAGSRARGSAADPWTSGGRVGPPGCISAGTVGWAGAGGADGDGATVCAPAAKGNADTHSIAPRNNRTGIAPSRIARVISLRAGTRHARLGFRVRAPATGPPDGATAGPRGRKTRRDARRAPAASTIGGHTMPSDATSGPVETDETARLIASNKVEGTAVYDGDGQRLGSVYNFMVDKYTGQVAYAVLSFGGFLGIGENYRALPWHSLTYDTGLGGYVVGLSRQELEAAPRHDIGEDPITGTALA